MVASKLASPLTQRRDSSDRGHGDREVGDQQRRRTAPRGSAYAQIATPVQTDHHGHDAAHPATGWSKLSRAVDVERRPR